MSGGTLMDGFAHDIMAQRFMTGEISASEMSEFAGDLSGAERQAITDNLINDRIRADAEKLNITESDLADIVLLGKNQFNAESGHGSVRKVVRQMEEMAPGINETYNKYFNRHGEFTGTEDDKENEDYKLMIKQINERGRLLQDFNNSMNEEFARLSKELIAEDISFFNASGYSNALQRARHFVIKEDFDEDNDSVQNAKLQNIANMTYEGGAFTDEQLKNAKAKKIADAQARILATKSEITASGVFESSFVRGDAPDQAYTRNNVSSTSVLGDIQKKYNEVMKDNVLTASENRDISSMINQMQSDYGNMGDDDKELLLKLEDLIAVVKQNSNIIVDNTMDGTD